MVRRLKAKMHQGIGKVRRLVLCRLRKRYVDKQHAHRQGECVRCGTCCKLLFHCPFLIEHADGSTSCRIHQKRPANCRVFPINRKDLRDRDLLLPKRPCGYTFSDPDA